MPTKLTHAVQGLRSPDGLYDEAVLTLTTLQQYAKDHPDAPVFAVDYDIEAQVVEQFLTLHLPQEVQARLFKAEKLLKELYDATVGYRGDRLPLREKHLNDVFHNVRTHINKG